MQPRRAVLGGLALSLAGCTGREGESTPPEEPYPMLVFNKRDEDTVIVTLDVLDSADYVVLETATTDQTERIESEGDQVTFRDLNGGNITVTAVVEQDGEAYRFEGQTFDPTYTPPTATPEPTPTGTTAVEFRQKKVSSIIVETELLGLGDAEYVLVRRTNGKGFPKPLEAFQDVVYFDDLEVGEVIEATAVADEEHTVVDSYTVTEPS